MRNDYQKMVPVYQDTRHIGGDKLEFEPGFYLGGYMMPGCLSAENELSFVMPPDKQVSALRRTKEVNE